MIRFLLWFLRILFFAIIIFVGGALAMYAWFSRDLPNYHSLLSYQPPVVSRVYAADGAVMAEFAREKRVFVSVQNLPPLLRQAFISAEDRNFYNHSGLNLRSMGRAVLFNVQNLVQRKRLQGASTITQQVVKNMLTGNDRTWQRKVREAILALEIEKSLTKEQILEVYMNEIFLGAGAYGVTSAARVYFNKLPSELTIAQMAYLAALPKSPTNYHPIRHRAKAIERRNSILERMREDNAITPEQEKQAANEALETVLTERTTPQGSYFTEEIRRQLIDTIGERDLYAAGLSIMTTQDNTLQNFAQQALQNGLQKYDRARGYRGALLHLPRIPTDEAELKKILEPLPIPRDVPQWSVAIVTSITRQTAELLLPLEKTLGHLDITKAKQEFLFRGVALAVGDVVLVEKLLPNKNDAQYALRQVPAINGALVALDPRTGRVLAMQGGFSYALSEYNRATQALRQPGSAFKPFVYAAALDSGFTPNTPISDEPLTLDGGNGKPWSPQNFDKKYLGVVPLRVGLERSRNLMTVRLAQSIGSEKIAEYARRFGVDDSLPQGLSSALGAGETTLLRMVAAYAVFASGGKQVLPVLTDAIYDRAGQILLRNTLPCDACTPSPENNKDPALPIIPDARPQILNAGTAYQITTMLEGVVQRGTARALADLNIPLAGKTGTTNDAKDVWFMGYTPDLVVGCYLGFDDPKSLGNKITAGDLAVPVVKDFLRMALQHQTARDFVRPEGLEEVLSSDGVVSYNNPETMKQTPPMQTPTADSNIDASYDDVEEPETPSLPSKDLQQQIY